MTDLILITGVPASGKTSLAQKLNQTLRYPILSKDAIKERLYDTLGCETRERSRELGKASMDILSETLERLLESNVSCIIEANFRPELDTVRVKELLKKTNARVIQIVCKGESEEVFKRFRDRALSSKRHSGHCEPDHLEEFHTAIIQGLPPLDLPGILLTFDTTILHDQILNQMAKEVKTVIRATNKIGDHKL